MGKIYPEEFRRKAVELYRLDEDATFAEVARDLGCSGEAVRNWVRQADIDDGVVDDEDAVTSEKKAEVARLRREKARLEKEVRILKAATAYFASDQL